MLTRLIRKFAYPAAAALLFGMAFVASLFFNGMRIEYFSLSLSILMFLFFIILWRGYSRGLHIPKTPLSVALILFWAWLAITLLWTSAPYVSMVNFWWVGGAVLVFWLMTLLPEDNHPYLRNVYRRVKHRDCARAIEFLSAVAFGDAGAVDLSHA